ncbi:hypothetical protein GIB67_042603 [Kingdonia uniflora]|uniref:Bicarbonate transporter-like transmembrane domain-containing protein n=1 Tax=Kingdonia uniflora TaxID=39325 RepID=A0A7J7M1G6_9MAGN|nr:hypothetical protein GIB67_042603 [Kingdonia uniflora]
MDVKQEVCKGEGRTESSTSRVPISIEIYLLKGREDLGHELFLVWAGWVCIWIALMLFLLAIFNACTVITKFTRIAGKLFGMLIVVLFVQEAVKGVVSEFKIPKAEDPKFEKYQFQWLYLNEVLATIFSFGLLYTALKSRRARSWRYGTIWLRSFVADYGVPLMTLVWTALSYSIPSKVPLGVPRRLYTPLPLDPASLFHWTIIKVYPCKGDAILSYEDPSAAHPAGGFYNNHDLRGYKINVAMAEKSVPRDPSSFGYGLAMIINDMFSTYLQLATNTLERVAPLTHVVGNCYKDTPLTVTRRYSRKRVPLQVSSLLYWYLGEQCSLQVFGVARVLTDPLPTQDMFGDRQILGDRYLDRPRGQEWVDGKDFLIDHISYNLYWAKVSTPYILQDYSWMINTDVINPRAIKRWIIPPRFTHSMPQETQFTQEDIDTSIDPAWWFRVADVDGTGRLLGEPRLSDVPGVPSAGLYHDTEING